MTQAGHAPVRDRYKISTVKLQGKDDSQPLHLCTSEPSYQADEVKSKLTTLETDRAKLEELLNRRGNAIADAAALLRFNAEHQEAADVVARLRERVDAVQLPRDAAAAAPLLAELDEIRAEVDANDDKVKTVNAHGEALQQSNPEAAPEVKQKLDALAADRAALAEGRPALSNGGIGRAAF